MTSVWENRHPGVAHFKEVFAFDHLPEGLVRDTSRQCANMAEWMVSELKDGPELTAGLRALWEAKNCFVLQAVKFNGTS